MDTAHPRYVAPAFHYSYGLQRLGRLLAHHELTFTAHALDCLAAAGVALLLATAIFL